MSKNLTFGVPGPYFRVENQTCKTFFSPQKQKKKKKKKAKPTVFFFQARARGCFRVKSCGSKCLLPHTGAKSVSDQTVPSERTFFLFFFFFLL